MPSNFEILLVPENPNAVFHARKHPPYIMFFCQRCDGSKHSKNGLKSHNKSAHRNRKIICPICQNSFKDDSALQRHRDGLPPDDDKTT